MANMKIVPLDNINYFVYEWSAKKGSIVWTEKVHKIFIFSTDPNSRPYHWQGSGCLYA